jgi:CheY-like chemotaxis protein
MSPSPISILIIEDDLVLRTAYEMALKHDGYVVRVATDGIEGLAAAKTEEPDIILLDMLMPNLNGLEFLRAYQPKQDHPKVKVIVLSNMSLPSDVHEAMELGAVKYLTKSSFTPKEITSIIKEVLAGG